MNEPILEIKNLAIESSAGIPLVHDITVTARSGQTTAIVGESGSGKTLTALAALGLAPGVRVTHGEVRFRGEPMPPNLTATRKLLGQRIGVVFQDPLASFDPRQAVGQQIVEHVADAGNKHRRRELAIQLMSDVGIADPDIRVDAYPHQLSGGMRQRAAIAMALAAEPELLIADEPTTALDVTVQAQILDLVKRLQETRQLAVIWITHDLGVVMEIADEVSVVYGGNLVESALGPEMFERPRHRYTAALLDSLPTVVPGSVARPIPGSPPPPGARHPGCVFLPRCSAATEACATAPPPWIEEPNGGHRCWNPPTEPQSLRALHLRTR